MVDKSFRSHHAKPKLTEEEVAATLGDVHLSNDVGFLRYLYSIFPTETVFHRICTFEKASLEEDFIQVAIEEHPEWCAPYMWFGILYAQNENYKMAMLCHMNALQRCRTNQEKFILEKLSTVSAYTEWGAVFTENERKTIEESNLKFMVEKLNQSAIAEKIVNLAMSPTLTMDSRERISIYTGSEWSKLPRFFRWIVPFHLAAMSTPRNENDIQILKRSPLNIQCVVTLTEETPLNEGWFDRDISNEFLPVSNYKAPTISQVKHIIEIVARQRKRTLVHCGGGKGRAGTVLACYIATCGFGLDVSEQPAFTAKQAIDIIRHMRPGSIETREQEEFVASYVSHLWKHGFDDPVEEPTGSILEIAGKFSPKTSFVCLVGAQGSGKSTFAEHLSGTFKVISQDELGTKAACFDAIGKAVKEKKQVIIDRCNPTVQVRKDLLEAAFKPRDAMCIFFDYEEGVCLKRANSRTNHPTIKQGRAGTAVKSTLRMMEPPTNSEGFECVVRVGSLEGVEKLLRMFNVSSATDKIEKLVMKFPRTRHLLNLGSASRDDLILSDKEAENFLKTKEDEVIVIQEKIDGANMGISLGADNNFVIQNRSHLVNSKSHVQFKSLDAWIERHRAELWEILDGDVHPGRYVLFGEWMAARHSIVYDKLPDTFVAFDLYDMEEKNFFSVSLFKARLEGTNVASVPIIAKGKHFTTEDLKKLVTTKSEFCDGTAEGIYVRKDASDHLLKRAKVVRPDFICGNEHWSRGMITWNKVAMR
jgi:atypical dual specificity phosphatase